MKASILAVGSELLRTDRLDTNSLILTEVLENFGVELISKGVVGDSIDSIASAVARLVDQVDLLLITGGLGPTSDDVTRYAVAQAIPILPGRIVVRTPRWRQAGIRAVPERLVSSAGPSLGVRSGFRISEIFQDRRLRPLGPLRVAIPGS